MQRRTFLVASATGLAGYRFGQPTLAAPSASPAPQPQGKAKSTILFFLCGGSSHIDMWDLKPQAPVEYRGEFNPVATTAPGVEISEHLPLTARQAHHLSIVRSVRGSVNTNDHHAGYYYNLTGHVPDRSFLTLGNNRTPFPDDWPYMGSVVSAKGRRHEFLPSAITLPHKPSRLPYTRPGQFAARLGLEHDPMYLYGTHKEPLKFQAPALELQQGITGQRLADRRELLAAFDAARRDFDRHAQPQTWSKQQDRAISLLVSQQATDAFDIAQEPEAVRERYGTTANAMSLLLARRLAEAGVPFITVFWLLNNDLKSKCKSAGSWDTHGNNFNCLKDSLLPEFDQCFSALVEDLAQRNMLDETLLLVTSEMGRKPKVGDPRSGGVSGAGRDHWTHCLSNVLAGGGLQGGQTYGTTDRFAEYPAEKPVTPAHIAKTVYHAMGIKDLMAQDLQGRPYHLLEEGEPLHELF